MDDKKQSKQMLKKLAYSFKLKNKTRDIKIIYDFGYQNGLSDEEISNCLQEVGF